MKPKPCERCGAEPSEGIDGCGYYAIYCPTAFCPYTIWYPTKGEAIEAWNRGEVECVKEAVSV